MVFLKRLVLIIDEFIEGELKMKLTTKKLRQIIREEVANTVKEAGYSQITRRQREDERNAGVDDAYSDSVRASPDEKVEWMIEKLQKAWPTLMELENLSAEDLAIALKTGENLKHHSYAWRGSILNAADKDQDLVDQIVDASMEQG